MAKKNETGKNNKRVVDPQKKKRKISKKSTEVSKEVPLVCHEVNDCVNANANVHPRYLGMDE